MAEATFGFFDAARFAEGDDPSVTMVLSGLRPADVTYTVSVTGGSATAGEDFEPYIQTETFSAATGLPPTEYRTFTIDTFKDTRDEGVETINFNISLTGALFSNGLSDIYRSIEIVDDTPPSGRPTIIGNLVVGAELRADLSGLTDADGMSNITYQWETSDLILGGENEETYTLKPGNGGSNFAVTVYYTGGNGLRQGVRSAETEVVRDVALKLDGGPGPDTLEGLTGHDRLRGFGGNDLLYGGLGDDLLIGGAGTDRMRGGEENDTLRGGGGSDPLFGGDGQDALFGGAGADDLNGDAGGDVLFGGGGDDRIFSGTGHDRLFGGRGDDFLNGSAGRDRIEGGKGNDVLSGEAGRNVLIGGRGADEFYFGLESTNDKIVDLSERDTLFISSHFRDGEESVQDMLDDHLTDLGNKVVIHFDGDARITLLRVDADTIAENIEFL